MINGDKPESINDIMQDIRNKAQSSNCIYCVCFEVLSMNLNTNTFGHVDILITLILLLLVQGRIILGSSFCSMQSERSRKVLGKKVKK
jgi:hypothetical protein